MHFSLSTSLLCLSRILFLDAYMFYALVECWTCKWYFAFKLISLHVRMFIPYVNEHCGHYSLVIACMIKSLFIASFHFAWSHYACFTWITNFSAYNDQIVLLCFKRYLFLWFKSFTNSRASQILELGVSEFCSVVSNSHVKSRVCFRVFLQNSQIGRL